MTFDESIQALKDGHVVTRSIWTNRSCGWHGRMVLFDDTTDASMKDWAPTEKDRTATDWILVERFE